LYVAGIDRISFAIQLQGIVSGKNGSAWPNLAALAQFEYLSDERQRIY